MRREERVKLSDGSLVPVSQSITVPIAEWQALKKQVEEGTLYNTEEIITESGTWTAKATGWHEVTLYRGGEGGCIYNGTVAYAGKSYAPIKKLMYFEKGQSVAVTIGAAGKGGAVYAGLVPDNAVKFGGDTRFGDFLHNGSNPATSLSVTVQPSYYEHFSAANGVYQTRGYSTAPGGGWEGTTAAGAAGRNFGAGGGAIWIKDNPAASHSGDGYQGAVFVRYYDPTKR